MADTTKVQSIKHFEGRAGKTIQAKTLNWKRSAHLIPTYAQSSYWQATRPPLVMREATQLTLSTHPTKPTCVDALKASDLGGI